MHLLFIKFIWKVKVLFEYGLKKHLSVIFLNIRYMLFSGDEALKEVKVLSGGEKVRCVLSKIMLSGANFLIFDEPTNHLDMESITAVNNGMQNFKGNILFTSHDHQLMQTVANRIIDIKENGEVIDKEITYNEYLGI